MSINMRDLADRVPRPDEGIRNQAREALDALAKPVGALGRLEDLAAWLAACQGQCPPQPIRSAQVVIFAGDHGIADAGVSAYPSDVTGLMVRSFVDGGAAINVLARAVGASVRVVDLGVNDDLADLPLSVTEHKVRAGSGRIDREDALTLDEAQRAFEIGQALADAAIDSGADLLIAGDMGIGNTTPATTLTVILTNGELSSLVGRGTGIDDRTWMRKAAAIRDAARRGRPVKDDPMQLLATVASADIAAMTGFLVQATLRRTPVVLDGIVSGAAALVAQRISHRCNKWFVAGHRSVEPAHTAALSRLGLVPLLEYDMRLGEGTGAVMALSSVIVASRLLSEMSTLEQVLATSKQPSGHPADEPSEPGDEGVAEPGSEAVAEPGGEAVAEPEPRLTDPAFEVRLE